jgi:hypothetical protein
MTTKRKPATKPRKPKVTAKHIDARPTIYHAYWCEKLCTHVRMGWSIRRFTMKPENPTYKTIMKWQDEQPEFREKLARAREDRAENNDDYAGFLGEEVVLGNVDPQAAKVAIDIRMRQAAISKPRKYGNKLELGGAGADGAIIVRFAEGDDKLG